MDEAKDQTLHRKPGRLRGMIRIGKDFDAPLPAEIEKAFLEDK